MYPESKKKLYLFRMLAGLLTALCIMSVGMVATGYQVLESERHEALQAARLALIRTDLLIDEAEQAAVMASPYLAQPCSSSVRNELNRIAVKLPHLRVISLLKGNQLNCSSFDVPVPRTMDISQYAGNRLSLRHGSLITPDAPHIVLLTAFPEGTVSVSIAVQHLTETLSLLSMHTELSLTVGNQVLSPWGKILSASAAIGNPHIRSVRYPYFVNYVLPEVPPLRTLPVRGKVLFVLFCILSTLGGGLVWWFSFRPPSPYDQLEEAIKRREIIPWYQPVVCSGTGEIYGVEVLARWKHPSGVYIPPDVFIPQAEKSGLIIPLTRQLMTQAVKDLVPVISRLRQPFHVAVNISGAHIKAGKVTVEDFRQLLTSFPYGSIQLVAEITEREPFTHFANLEELLEDLRWQGIRIALDDFGTGYSSLGYLNTLPVDYIKIDRSFVSRLKEEEDSDGLIDCVINMARTLGLGIVAEGVETRYQAEWLAAHRVAFQQGYYFSRPLPASEFIQLTVLQQVARVNP